MQFLTPQRKIVTPALSRGPEAAPPRETVLQAEGVELDRRIKSGDDNQETGIF
jgi:hypothetical protein